MKLYNVIRNVYFYIKLFLFIYYFVYDNIESVEDFYYVMFVDKNCYILY